MKRETINFALGIILGLLLSSLISYFSQQQTGFSLSSLSFISSFTGKNGINLNLKKAQVRRNRISRRNVLFFAVCYFLTFLIFILG
jgi:hypothetical protein